MYRLSGLTGAKSGCSLNELVRLVQTRLDKDETVQTFDRKLVARGYAPLPDYDEPRFAVSDELTYRVGSDFPRLMRSKLPAGVVNVAYDIKLETIDQYKCDGTNVHGGV